MPYIKPQDRINIKRRVEDLSDLIDGPGDLNYAITVLIQEFIQGPVSYSDINTIVGVLECAKLEFYRRKASPYEDRKIIENGDAY